MSVALVWFRQDLRCVDNPALSAACANHQYIIPLYILDASRVGAAQQWWLHHSLEALTKSLSELGLSLILRQGEPNKIIHDLIKTHKINSVYWNRCYEPKQISSDTELKKLLLEQNFEVHSFNSSLLNEPWTVKNKEGNFFKVFTAYWKQCLKQTTLPAIAYPEAHSKTPAVESDNLSDWQLLPTKPDWAKGFSQYWSPGEAGALEKLHYFIDHHLHDYKERRNLPALNATSNLSPHLHFGEISPWQIWQAIAEAKMDKNCDLKSADNFMSEIGWREFSYYLLYHFPQLPEKNLRPEFDNFPWHPEDHHLKKWQKGLTGFPIVDAGMRELWHTGYMHNRIRMITASFLIKDLFIDWREGARWFNGTLLDADLANNNASWQWVAGSGADAAPYFRIFNPVLQGEKFDPQGEYVRRWVPELAKVPNKWLHKPWEAPEAELPVKLGKDYPHPLVNHAEARKMALEYYQNLKSAK
ncbi:MAG: deoxyribodipyrimidine photo-lyase [Legionella sp.]|nr:deoxyribodipyrimidine photo-lyase [Legionella sp.]